MSSAKLFTLAICILSIAGLSICYPQQQQQQQQQQLQAGQTQASLDANLLADDQQQQPPSSSSLVVVQNPKLTVQVLENLLRSLVYSINEVGIINGNANTNNLAAYTSQTAQKRGLDLGMTRGFSGSQAGKHLMGLSAANFANGPGK